ncbi:MAG TPA: putative lipoprotein [Gaiellaceae bacterium]
MRGFGPARVALVPVLLLLVGCSISTSLSTSSTSSQSASDSSASSSTSSDSSSRSSESSSRSSMGSRERDRYLEDVRSYTAANVRGGVPLETFQKELGDLARAHGLTNWEDDETTYLGIGEGLSEAAVGQAQLEMYKTSFSRSDPAKMQAIQRGYDTR